MALDKKEIGLTLEKMIILNIFVLEMFFKTLCA